MVPGTVFHYSVQMGQLGLRVMRCFWNCMVRRSMVRRWPARVVPRPVMSLMASMAPRQATVPETAPRTGNFRVQVEGMVG